MQVLYSASSSNKLKALCIILTPAHLYTPASQLLNGVYNPDTHHKAPRVINVCVLPASQLRLNEPAQIYGNIPNTIYSNQKQPRTVTAQITLAFSLANKANVNPMFAALKDCLQ